MRKKNKFFVINGGLEPKPLIISASGLGYFRRQMKGLSNEVSIITAKKNLVFLLYFQKSQKNRKKRLFTYVQKEENVFSYHSFGNMTRQTSLKIVKTDYFGTEVLKNDVIPELFNENKIWPHKFGLEIVTRSFEHGLNQMQTLFKFHGRHFAQT